MFDRIWACLFAFLLSIFPSLDRYSPAMDWRAATGTVLTAIQAGDIDTIESFMCKNIKDNTTDLRGEITKLISLIEDNVTSTSSEFFDDFSVASSGKTIMQATSISQISTSSAKYQLNMIWEYYNNFSFTERGIRQIALFLVTNTGYEELARIRATDGIGRLHS